MERLSVSQEVFHVGERLFMHERKTKIVGTLGPASIPKIREVKPIVLSIGTYENVSKLILAGINVFRLNFSHVTDPETQTPIIEKIRDESASLGLPVAILGDLCGPKIRCGTFKNVTIRLTKGETVRMLHSSEPGEDGIITTPIPEIVHHVQVGHRILLDDGSIALRVTDRISENEIICEVIIGGILKAKKGINVPDMKVQLPALTAKDAKDAEFMYRKRLDYIALSFVQSPNDIQDLLDLFERIKQDVIGTPDFSDLEEDWRPHIIAKIEKPQALDVIDEIIHIADGLMVARGDLGVECSLEQVPVIQKTLIRKCNAAEKPVITATQMLESMINSPVPTRAEVSDVSNAVFDGTDAVMLSAECATGQFPVETVAMMASICLNAEAGIMVMHPPTVNPAELTRIRKFYFTRQKAVSEFAHSIADGAFAVAIEAKATAMIVFTTTSEMAIFVSKHRPSMSIIAVTPSASIFRRLALLYGVQPVLSNGLRIPLAFGKGISNLKSETDLSQKLASGKDETVIHNTDEILAMTEKDILESPSAQLTPLKEGDTIVFCAGFHHPFPGLSNTIKISRFGDSNRAHRVTKRWRDSIMLASRASLHEKIEKQERSSHVTQTE